MRRLEAGKVWGVLGVQGTAASASSVKSGNFVTAVFCEALSPSCVVAYQSFKLCWVIIH